MQSAIYKGEVTHHRKRPREHLFSYNIFMMYLDLEELPDLFNKFLLWSSKNFNLAWFNRKDHHGSPEKSLSLSIRELIKKHHDEDFNGPITLLTHLRYFGYVMNPVSFYYCWDKKYQNIKYIVVEINNTPWGEQYCYVLNANDGELKFDLKKRFHVSPYMGMEQDYIWQFNKPNEKITVLMENYENDNHLLTASIKLYKENISSKNLMLVLISYPFVTMKVLFAIYWQAFNLWLKNIPFHPHPKHKI